MPFQSPKRVKGGWALPLIQGGYLKIRGKIAKYRTKEAAQKAGDYITKNKL